MPTGYCPECDTDIKFNSSPRKGQEVSCPGCGAYLKVASESPIELDWADDGWEDFDEDDDDFEYDDDDFEYDDD